MSLDRPCVHWNDGYCQKFSDNEVQSWCVEGPCEYEQPSHADHIRAMSDEELAYMRVHYNPETDMYTNDTGEAYYDFVSAIEDELEWLKQPAEED